MTTVADYCKAYRASGMTPIDFARHMLAWHKTLCFSIMDSIGMWPSSEPELRALQLVF